MRILFIRHGKTLGNLEKRYIGNTDETLCDIGKVELLKKSYPKAEACILSPMRRCIETARCIYGDISLAVYYNLRECNFGDFENKNYDELCDNPDYIKWLESVGKLPFPNGEDHENFKNRCVEAFLEAVSDYARCESICFVVHGGTIMAILERFADGDFYDYQLENGCGYVTEFENGKITIIDRIE